MGRGFHLYSRRDASVSLTAQKVRILRHLAGGMSVCEISCTMSIAVDTVYEHVEVARKRLGARSTLELMRMAIHHGFVDPASP